MDFKLNKTQRLVVNAAAKETTRPVLHCVHIRKGVIEAANGYILVGRQIDYDGDENLLIDIDDIARQKDAKELGAVIYSGDRGEIRALGADVNIICPQEGTFPDTKLLYPTQEPVFKIAFARSHLLEILKCLDKDEELIKFYFYGIDMPTKIVAAGGEVTGLMMPMYADSWDK